MGEVETEQGRGKHVSGTEERMLGVQSAPYRHEVEVGAHGGWGGWEFARGESEEMKLNK